MAVSSAKMTLAEYLAYEDDTDSRYELVDGELVVMPPESRLNRQIASLLFAFFLKQGVPFSRLDIGSEIVTMGARATTRLPDFTIFTEELVAALEGATRSTITLDMPPPLLAIEVVSPGQKNRDRDYRYKRSEYAARGIAEYWVVDPQEGKVTILKLASGLYEESVYVGDAVLQSPIFGQLPLTAEQVLQARMD